VLSPWRPRGSGWGGVVVCVQLFCDPFWTSGGGVVVLVDVL
jgi:hypothetical protein